MLTKSEAAGGSSLAALTRGRSQSMGGNSQHSPLRPITRTRVESEISSSSTINEVEARARGNELRDINLRENENLLESGRRVGFISEAALAEVSSPTNQGSNLSPRRDGFYARIQRLMYGGASVGVGALAGVGVSEVLNSTRQINSTSNIIQNLPDELNIIG